LISIAAIFLEGKNLENVSDVQKRIFLKRKGLTDEMIDEAYKRFQEKKDKESGTQTLPLSSPEAGSKPVDSDSTESKDKPKK
jgi:hypothetical protein